MLHCLRQRGYNQSLLLVKGLARKFPFPVNECLQRIRKTQTQVRLTKEERERNIKGAFAVKKSMDLPKQVFLVDDVVTSGATLKEAAKVLKKAGVGKVWGVTLAHGN